MLRNIMAIVTLFTIAIFWGVAVWQAHRLEERLEDVETAVWKVEMVLVPSLQPDEKPAKPCQTPPGVDRSK